MRKPDKTEKKVPTLEDDLQRAATEAAGAAVINWLRAFVEANADCKIREIKKHHAIAMADAAITGWLKARVEQSKSNPDVFDELVRTTPNQPFNDPVSDLYAPE